MSFTATLTIFENGQLQFHYLIQLHVMIRQMNIFQATLILLLNLLNNQTLKLADHLALENHLIILPED